MMHHSKMLSLLIEFEDVDNCICFDNYPIEIIATTILNDKNNLERVAFSVFKT